MRSMVLFSANLSYLKLRPDIVIPLFPSVSGTSLAELSSSGFSCISLILSNDSLTSWSENMKLMNCDTGELSCPMIYCMASMAPSDSVPFITAPADRAVITIFFISFMNMLPASCVCCSLSDLSCMSNRSAWMSSHSQRRRWQQSCSLVSCIVVTNSKVLFWFSLCFSK